MINSTQDSEEKKRTDGDSELREEPCNGEDISVTSEKEVHTEMRLVATASDQQMAPKDGIVLCVVIPEKFCQDYANTTDLFIPPFISSV